MTLTFQLSNCIATNKVNTNIAKYWKNTTSCQQHKP